MSSKRTEFGDMDMGRAVFHRAGFAVSVKRCDTGWYDGWVMEWNRQM